MIHKQEQNTTKTFVTAFVLCVCFLAVSFSILFLMLQKSEAEGVQYLRDNAAQSQIALQRQMRGDFQTLDGIAVCLTGAAALDDEILPGLLETINNGNAFIRMGMASPEGKVDLVDLEGNWISDIDISFREFFQKSMRGENAISETIKDSYGEGFINYYGVPVQKDGRIIGVLCAVNSSDSFREIVDVSVFNGQGFTNIVDGEGKLVIRATTGMMQSSEAVSLWELGEFTEEERASARGILSSGAQGELSYRCENEDMLAVLEPIGVNDWFVMSAVPRSAIRQNYSQTLLAMGIIIVAALLIFLSLLQHQRRMMSKNRNALLHLAYDDPLTGCANFSRFLLEGERLLEENRQLGRRCAVWYCDLKKFKYYNDLFGYRAGDQLLMRLAGIFDQNKPEHSTFCRVSGDNFVGLYCYHSRAELENRFAKLIRQLSDAEERASALELCMGVYFVEEGMLTLNDMVDRANMAQKSVKDKPGSQLAFFTRQIRERSLFESEIQALGEKALAAGEFLLYLQPKVDIQNGDRVVGAEVLARWNSPSHGMIPPGEFIPLFEKSGLIVQLDRYMLRQACQ